MNIFEMNIRTSDILGTGLVLGIIAILDYLTGTELGIFVFYCVPIGATAWRTGIFPAAILSAISALIWFGIDFLGGHVYSHPVIAVWNTIIRLASFLIIAWWVTWTRDLLEKEKNTSASLRRALAEIKILEGILPICASCKKIRNPNDKWEPIESYISARSPAQFSHGLCPDCAHRFMEEAGLTGREKD